jgi:hypothetical protein
VALAGNRLGHLVQPLLRHIGQDDLHPEPGRVPGQCGPDTAAGAGDDRRLAGEELFL